MKQAEHGIGTYPVGLLADFQQHKLKRGFKYLVERIKNREWRAVRNSFNGYLAEWHYPPEGVTMYHCGHGWTRRAALRSLGQQIVYANRSDREKMRIK